MAVAYCGPAPEPQALLSAWNLDLVAGLLCAIIAFVHFRYGPREGRFALGTGLVLLLLLFVTPLCALTVSLFSARVAHHIVLVAVIAPLMVLAFPTGNRPRRLPLSMLVGTHAVILWAWHAPPIYEQAIYGVLPYWAMQLSLLGSAFLMWQRILDPATSTGSAMLALLATVIQMGMLGALLTFARQPLYEPHLTTTLPYGLTAMADQQLGGLIMWVPAAIPYLMAVVWLLFTRLDQGAARKAG